MKVCAVGWEPNPKHVEYLQRMSEAYKSCGYRVVINTRVGVGAHNMRTQFVEKTNDDRDSGAHVREDDAPLDKVKMSQSSPCLTVRSGEVQSPQYHRGQNCRVHQHRSRYKETYQGQGCGGDEAGCGSKSTILLL